MPRTSNWAQFRLLWWLLVSVVVVGPFAFVFVHGRVSESESLLLPLVAWGLSVLLVGLRLQQFRCPRCHKHFFHRRPFLLALLARRCACCMLGKG